MTPRQLDQAKACRDKQHFRWIMEQALRDDCQLRKITETARDHGIRRLVQDYTPSPQEEAAYRLYCKLCAPPLAIATTTEPSQ